MIAGGGYCSYEHGSQLNEALAFLEDHTGQIAFVMIDIGSNDFSAALQHNVPLRRYVSAAHPRAAGGQPGFHLGGAARGRRAGRPHRGGHVPRPVDRAVDRRPARRTDRPGRSRRVRDAQRHPRRRVSARRLSGGHGWASFQAGTTSRRSRTAPSGSSPQTWRCHVLGHGPVASATAIPTRSATACCRGFRGRPATLSPVGGWRWDDQAGSSRIRWPRVLGAPSRGAGDWLLRPGLYQHGRSGHDAEGDHVRRQQVHRRIQRVPRGLQSPHPRRSLPGILRPRDRPLAQGVDLLTADRR